LALDIEYICQSISGKNVWFAVDRTDTDPYTVAMRTAPILQNAVAHVQKMYNSGRRHLKVVDIGANIGTVSLTSAILTDAKVLAIEGLSKNISLLSSAVIKNGLGGRVFPVHLAASDDIDVVSMTGASAWGGMTRADSTGTATPSASMAQILEIFGFENCDLIKIDIEGSEKLALTGAEKMLSIYKNIDVVFESNSHTCAMLGYKCQDLWDYFFDLRYELYQYYEQFLVPLLPGRPQSNTVIDILATRSSLHELIAYGYEITTMLDTQLLKHLELEAGGTVHQKQHVVRQEAFMPPALAADPRWKKALELALLAQDAAAEPG
jgi:FkbM family methyltransferase